MEAPSDSDWKKWYACTVCSQYFHGKVKLAMGWECWKTYVRLDAQHVRVYAMTKLGNGLQANGQAEGSPSPHFKQKPKRNLSRERPLNGAIASTPQNAARPATPPAESSSAWLRSRPMERKSTRSQLLGPLEA